MSVERERLRSYYNGDAYDQTTNPGGLARGGHRQATGLMQMIADMVVVADECDIAADRADSSASSGASWPEELGPNDSGGAIAYVSATQFKIVGVDRRDRYLVGRALQLDQGTNAYGYVQACSYSNGDTLVTVQGCTVDVGIASNQGGHVYYGQDTRNAPSVICSTAETVAGTVTDKASAPAGVKAAIDAAISGVLAIIRESRAGVIVEWEGATIPTLADGKPLGLELDGAVASLTTYPLLARKWCGSSENSTAPAWYKCDSNGSRNSSGAYIKLQDRRGEFARGWDHGRGVDAGRTLAGQQAADNAPHTHGAAGGHLHSVASQNVNTGGGTAHKHDLVNQAQVQGGAGSVIVHAISGGANANTTSTTNESSHTHPVTVPAQNTGSVADHTHGSQGAEGRPRNVATMFIVYV